VIPPIKFNKVPDYGIIYDIEGKNLSIKSFLLQDKKQNKKVQKIQSRLIKLGRMKRDAERNAC